MSGHEQDLAEAQREHWQRTYGSHPGMYGQESPALPHVTPPPSSVRPGAGRCWSWAPATAATPCSSPGRDSTSGPRISRPPGWTSSNGPPPTRVSPSGSPPWCTTSVSRYEHGGFAVHFFPRHLVDRLADGWILDEVHPFEEG